MDICRTYRLSEEQYFFDSLVKRAIVLHHTVSSTVESVFNWWQNDAYPDGAPRHIGTAYVVDKNGQVYEFFDPDKWAHHLGVRHPGNRRANQATIGIELVNEGGVIERNNGHWFWFSGHAPYVGPVHQLPVPWRGYKAFAAYPQAQIDSVIELVHELCVGFKIPRAFPPDPFGFDVDLINHCGIFAHCNVRQDKSDVHCGFPMPEFINAIQGRV